MLELTIGTDPELFVKNKVTNKSLSAHDLFPGTKEDPFPVPGGAIQIDGVAVEFNTAPASTVDEFVGNIVLVMGEINHRLLDHDHNLFIDISPTCTFEKEYFDALPDDPKMLGCSPDFNAYTGKMNEPPGTDEPFRTGAGHLHLGWGQYIDPHSKPHFALCRDVVKQLDMVIFEASLLWDKDDKRRSLYGNRGAFRPKHYGVEYRPPSNAYLQNEKIIRWVFDATKQAGNLILNHKRKIFDDGLAEFLRTNRNGRPYFSYLSSVYGIPELPEGLM